MGFIYDFIMSGFFTRMFLATFVAFMRGKTQGINVLKQNCTASAITVSESE